MKPKTTKLLMVAIAAMALAVVLSLRRNAPKASAPRQLENAGASPHDSPVLFQTTSSESQRRSARVLPNGPSEDAKHVLGEPPTPPADPDRRDSGGADPANPRANWAVNVEFRAGGSAGKQQIVSVLNREWEESNGSPTLYGFGQKTERWSLLDAASESEPYSKLELLWPYLSLDAAKRFTAEFAQQWLGAIEKAAPRIAPATVRASEPPAAAARRARGLEALRSEIEDAQVIVALVAPEGRPFDGFKMWDALRSLGLEWGDGDLFHWAANAGDDSAFSVSTSTDPGYFFPEEAVAGHLHVEDLVFGLSIPRTYQPTVVLEAMIRAAKYVQRRLGGNLVSAQREPLNEAALRASLAQTVQRMTAAGIEPGSDAALQLF